MRVGLVLGAGGAAGLGFHAGTLLALQSDLGWDPRSANIMVGSSAGSIAATLLRAGLTTDDLAAWGSAVEPLPRGREARRVLDAVDQEGVRFARPGRTWRLPTAENVLRARRPGNVRFSTLAMTKLPAGSLDGAATLRRIGALLPAWPRAPLWITAVRTSDARRVTFGKNQTAPLGDAIAASCAVPGVFRPVRIGHERYIDGGAHSPTNADLLASAHLDLVIVLSPMSGRPDALRRSPDHWMRLAHARRLRRECRRLKDAGTEVHFFEPDSETLRLMGRNAFDRSRTPGIVTAAFLAAGAQIANDHTLIEALGRASRAPEPTFAATSGVA